MTCVICGRQCFGKRTTCPSVCRSQQREALRITRAIERQYQRAQALRRWRVSVLAKSA